MGCYMSKPDNKVYVTEGKGAYFTYATASCQGWRREQEDAEDCVPYFDENASLFVLCDGHGGAEVAEYTVKHLPDFIKNHQLYKEGKYKEALEQAFIDFDAFLRTSTVLKELDRLAFEGYKKNDDDEANEQSKDVKTVDLADGSEIAAGSSNSGASSARDSSGRSEGAGTSGKNGQSSVVADVDAETLRREAAVPIGQLLDRYTDSGPRHPKGLAHRFRASPVVKSKDDEPRPSNSTTTEPAQGSSSDSNGDEAEVGSSSGTSSKDILTKEAILKQVLQRYFPADESSEDDSEFDGDNSSNEDGDDEDDENAGEGSAKKHRRMKHKRPSKVSTGSSSEDDDEDDEEEEEEEDDDEDDKDDDEDDDDEEDDDDSEESHVSEEGGDEDEESEDSDEVDEGSSAVDINSLHIPRAHRPGYDSGCTVVVALVKDGKLYVASAGDSRCIMIKRNGECKPMSFDHKPEDAVERKRIQNAGGRVTDGRVNGGLNLSRAFGDFTYKAELLDAKDQMITPCPRVEVADLDPSEVEYIFLACDGIWNSKRNAATASFIRDTARDINGDLVEICLNLFRTCIAPSTEGDGTGCDNMTCILVKFEDPAKITSTSEKDQIKADLNVKSEAIPSSAESSSTSCKRSTNDETNDHPTKRRCLSL